MARKGRMKSSNKKTHRRVTYPIPFLFSLDVEMLNSSIFNTIFQNNLVFSSKFTIFAPANGHLKICLWEMLKSQQSWKHWVRTAGCLWHREAATGSSNTLPRRERWRWMASRVMSSAGFYSILLRCNRGWGSYEPRPYPKPKGNKLGMFRQLYY